MEDVTEKPSLVFLHYFGGAAKSWKSVASLLDTQYNCILINLPGFGTEPALIEPSISSLANFVEDKLDGLGIGKYVLIGHSMGGKIALQIAANDKISKTVNQLILIAPSPPTIERMPEKEQQRMLIHPDKMQAVTTVKNSIVKKLNPDQNELAVSTQMMVDETTWRWWIKEGIKYSIANQVKDIAIPITVIASKDDPAVTYKMTIEDTIPNLPSHTKLITTAGIGHLFPLEDPEWTAKQILAILY